MSKEPKRVEVDASGRRLDDVEQKKKPLLNFILMGAGSVFTSMIVAGFILGYLLDTLFETQPIFILSCGVLGFIGGILKVHELLNKMDLVETEKKALKTIESGRVPLTEMQQKTAKNEK
ncbi:AtpZ/AtpI family protein [Galenea microaerophila]